MLLRLVPPPTAKQANPPTILFTLSLPNQPYTSKSLPLPNNLMAHRTVCLQEEIECPNVLLGEKSSWIMGIVEDVTFSMNDQTVSIELTDASKTVHTVSDECAVMLRRVCREVELSLAPSRPPSLPPTPSPTPPRSRSSSGESIHDVQAGPSAPVRPTIVIPPRRSPSSLLYSLISPLLPGVTGPSARALGRPPPARYHRRQARSILVDTFRRFILPTLKLQLPSAYLPWMTGLETKRLLVEFQGLRTEVDSLLDRTTVDWTPRIPLKRHRTSMSDLDTAEAGCESETSSMCGSEDESTPATSIFSTSSGQTCPQAFLLRIPPTHALPIDCQRAYASLLKRVTAVASRLQAVKRLTAKFDREESKRIWLESLDRGRITHRSLRRALSNGDLRPEQCKGVEPPVRSKLWRSWTAADQEKVELVASRSVHPAMMEVEEEMYEDASFADSDDESDLPVTPCHAVFPTRAITITLPSVVQRFEQADTAPIAGEQHRHDSLEAVSESDEMEADLDTEPDLASSSSCDSLDGWREEVVTPRASPEREDADGFMGLVMPRRPSLGRGDSTDDRVTVVEAGDDSWPLSTAAVQLKMAMMDMAVSTPLTPSMASVKRMGRALQVEEMLV